MRLTILLFTLLGISLSINAQTRFKVAEKFYSGLPDTVTNQIISSLDNLLISIDEDKLDTTLIDKENFDFNRDFFTYLKRIEGKDTIRYYFQGQLINLYPVENKQYSITIAYVNNNEIGRIFTFIVKENNGKFVFANPIKYNTKHWKTTTIGTITLYYPDTINTIRNLITTCDNFSEDIDIAIINENLSGNALKTKIRNIEKEITVGLTEIVEDGVTSKGSMFRKSIFEYPTLLFGKVDNVIPNRMIVEINSFANPYPNVKQEITSFIAKYLAAYNQSAAIDEYGLQPFLLNVLDKRRTMIEKLVSLFRFSYAENPRRSLSAKIRYFYDLYYLAKDTECAAYIQTPDFKQDFVELLAHDKQSFDAPAGWQEKEITQSPLVTDFPQLWNFLRDVYQSELPKLAFVPVPDEKEVGNTFIQIVQQLS
jgi:hypothetical protein